MKTKFLFVFALLMTLTGSYKENAKAASNFDVTTELLAFGATSTAPVFTQYPKDFTVRVGDDVTIRARCDGNPQPQLIVRRNGVEVKPSNRIKILCFLGELSLKITEVELADAGIYTMEICNDNGSVSAKFRLTVNDVE